MRVVHAIEEIPPLEGPITLSIGVYDGVHLGHQMILNKLNKAKRKGGSSVLLTFSNHPSSYFTPNSPVPQLTSLEHRLALLRSFNPDLVIVLPFNQTIAEKSYETFFKELRAYLPFDHLIVGEDARFGKGRLGGPQEIAAMEWKTDYLSKQAYHREPISSAAIRKFLQEGNLKLVKKMLGRPYSIVLPFDRQNVIRENDIQYKWVTGTDKLCLLPSAVYGVDLQTEGKAVPAIAFYRGTKNIHQETSLTLTLYFEKDIPPGDSIEIIFNAYLHDELDPDLKFSSKTTLLERLKPEFFPS